MIRAILRNGVIEPLEPLPSQWRDGQELLVEIGDTDEEPDEDLDELRRWEQDLAEAVNRIAADEDARFQSVLSDIERESKEMVRKEWGLSV